MQGLGLDRLGVQDGAVVLGEGVVDGGTEDEAAADGGPRPADDPLSADHHGMPQGEGKTGKEPSRFATSAVKQRPIA